MGARLCASIDAALEGHDARVEAEERRRRGQPSVEEEMEEERSRRRSSRRGLHDIYLKRSRSRSRQKSMQAWGDVIVEERTGAELTNGAHSSPRPASASGPGGGGGSGHNSSKDDKRDNHSRSRGGGADGSTQQEESEEQDSPPLGRQGSHSRSRSGRSARAAALAANDASLARTRPDLNSYGSGGGSLQHLHLITEEESVTVHPAPGHQQRLSPTGSSKNGPDRWDGAEWNDQTTILRMPTEYEQHEVTINSLLAPGTPPLQSWMSKQPSLSLGYTSPARITAAVEKRAFSPRDTPSVGFVRRIGSGIESATATSPINGHGHGHEHHGHTHSFSFKPYHPLFLTPSSATQTSDVGPPQQPQQQPQQARSPNHSPSASLLTLPPLQQLDSDFSASMLAATSFNPADLSILLCDPEGAELEGALLAAGYSVVLCDDALEAMSVLMQRPTPSGESHDAEGDVCAAGAVVASAAAVDFHLVILDAAASTPQGFHLLDWLRGTRYTSHLPVLVSSSDGSIASTERWLRRGVADVLRKPYVPALALSTIFTLLTQRHQQQQLPGLQLRGDMYKNELVAEKNRRRNKSLLLSPSTAGDVCHAPILLNIMVLSTHCIRISRTLLNWLGASFLLNVVPCTTTSQVLHRLSQCEGNQSPTRLALRSMVSGMSERIHGPLGADLLLLDEMMLGDSDEDRTFAAALTARGDDDSTPTAGTGQPPPMVPLMLLADSDSSAPPLSLLSMLQRCLVGVLEMPLSSAIVQSKLGAFLGAVEQHRRRFQLAQRAQAYRLLLHSMRTSPAVAASKRASARLSWATINADDLYRQTSLVLSPPHDPIDMLSAPCSPLYPVAAAPGAAHADAHSHSHSHSHATPNLVPPPLLAAGTAGFHGQSVSPSGHSRRISSRATICESRISQEEFAFAPDE